MVVLDTTCSYPACRAAIRWATVHPSGKRMPLEPYPDPDGNCIVVQDHPLTVRVAKKNEKIPAGIKRYAPHYATCPKWKKPGRPPEQRPQQVELALFDEGG